MPQTTARDLDAVPLPNNVRAFIAFRILFNARFYYPVLSVFFIDLGLSLDQYSLLNVAWAVSIVLCELPLGAVADRFGRRPLIVLASVLMIVEMAVMAFVPTGNTTILLTVLLVNRCLSGLAEAAASGADEALAYDTLALAGRSAEWPRVLSMMQTRMSMAFVLSMIVGALVYDASFLNGLLGTEFSAATTARFPVYLTLGLAFGALLAALRMTEPETEEPTASSALGSGVRVVIHFVRVTRLVLAVVLFSLILDSVVRLFLVMQSNYLRLIRIPEAYFGMIGALLAGLGILSPPIARRVIARCSPLVTFVTIAMLVLIGLGGVALGGGVWAVLWLAPLMLSFHLLQFASSHYLNGATPSSMRATVLSVKSLAGNLAYGAAGMAYAVAFHFAKRGVSATDNAEVTDVAFTRTLVWLPIVFLVLVLPVVVWARRIPRMCELQTGAGSSRPPSETSTN